MTFFDQLLLGVIRSVVSFFDRLWLHIILSVVCPFSISCGCSYSISCGCKLFDQLCDYFRSVVVTSYLISCVSFFDQLWLHVIRSVVVACYSNQLCDFFRSVVVACYSISCVTFFDQLWLQVI